MPVYIVLTRFTEQGIRNVKETTKRAQTFREMAKKLGITVKDLYWTLGEYDSAAIVDAPDEGSVTALGLSVGVQGNVRTQTIRAFTSDEISKILNRMV
ncbi:MAG TPA: GYD domain-containing protein [Gemmataceae bacterium]|jgi:uncharacterized protein with GYD domain|nr:GYD domain-containing protein [Gemmataceae bacterium]